jgi:hypothetical protein
MCKADVLDRDLVVDCVEANTVVCWLQGRTSYGRDGALHNTGGRVGDHPVGKMNDNRYIDSPWSLEKQVRPDYVAS